MIENASDTRQSTLCASRRMQISEAILEDNVGTPKNIKTGVTTLFSKSIF